MRLNMGTILWANLFALAVIYKACTSRVIALLRVLYWEFLLLLQVVKLPDLVRLWLVGRRRRIRVELLQFSYRPRYGDLVWLYVAILCLGMTGVQHYHPGGVPVLAWKWSVLRDIHPLSLGEGSLSQDDSLGEASLGNTRLGTGESRVQTLLTQNSPRYIDVEYAWDGSFLSHLQKVSQRLGGEISHEQEIAKAVDAFLQQQQGDQETPYELGSALILRVNFNQMASDSPTQEWQIDHLQMSIGNNLALMLRPRQDIFGAWFLEANIGVLQARTRQFLVRGTVSELLQFPERYARSFVDQDQRQIEELLLLLNRQLMAEGGLHEKDFISALYEYTSPSQGATSEEQLALLYIELYTANNQYSFVHYRTAQDPQGYLFDERGIGFATSDWGVPVASRRVSSGFGMRLHPLKKRYLFHRGIDYAIPIGTPVRATRDGLVARIGYDATYGHFVRLFHADGYATLYAHLREPAVELRTGYPVRKGDVIAYSGNSGLSTGPHLHYEVIFNGQPIDPKIVNLPAVHLLSPRQQQELKALLRERQQTMVEILTDIQPS